jgi:SanA protein
LQEFIKAMHKVKISIISFVACVLMFVAICNVWIISVTQKQIFETIESIPHRTVALVLGTSTKLSNGEPNPFFTNRIETAYQLYKNKKVDHIIVSGDNRSKYYNEPAEMRKALIAKGVPSGDITLDYAGLRTLDSIVRCKEVFDQENITIITQPFHSYRALFISQYYNIDAIVMTADEPQAMQAAKVIAREILARPLAVLDLYLLNTSPRHLGEKEELNSKK